MIIKNSHVFLENGTFEKKDIYVENHMIVASEDMVNDKTVIDADGLMMIPGLIDVHSHGAYGHDFSDADTEGLKTILQYEKENGITSYCPTSMTLPKEQLMQIFATAKEAAAYENGSRIVGINMEGPFLDPAKKGAHVEKYIQMPNVDFFNECNHACDNLVKLVTLAPNMPGAIDFIHALKDKVTISLGHTNADYDTAHAALLAGAHHLTHLYNAMPPISHREPGLIPAAIESDHCMAEVICDGIHIHPSVIRATFTMFGPERIVLISDSMEATGMANGTYELGGQKVTVKDRKATLENGTIAGSATNLFDCMKNAIAFEIPMADAIFAATRNPAKSIGLYHEIGSITVGKKADLLLIDKKDFTLKQVI